MQLSVALLGAGGAVGNELVSHSLARRITMRASNVMNFCCGKRIRLMEGEEAEGGKSLEAGRISSALGLEVSEAADKFISFGMECGLGMA